MEQMEALNRMSRELEKLYRQFDKLKDEIPGERINRALDIVSGAQFKIAMLAEDLARTREAKR